MNLPRTTADCLSHIIKRLTGPEYSIALTRIGQLVDAERAIALLEMDEYHRRQAGALLYKPLSRE